MLVGVSGSRGKLAPNSRETEERFVGKIREIRGVKAVKSLLKMEKK